MTSKRFRSAGEQGSELIELALVLPILLMIIAGIVDFGFLFQQYEVVTNAAREGARIAVLPGYTTADVQARVQNYLTAGGLGTAPAPTVTTGTLTLPSGLVVATRQVVVTYPHTFAFIGPIAGLVGGSGWTTLTLQASSTMRAEAAGAGTGS